MPGVDATFGCVEYELLMGIIWENMEEPCSFGPQSRPAIPIGRRLPPVGPQPEALGVDRSVLPVWQVEVCVGAIGVAVGGVPHPSPAASSKAGGPALAQVMTPDSFAACSNGPKFVLMTLVRRTRKAALGMKIAIAGPAGEAAGAASNSSKACVQLFQCGRLQPGIKDNGR